MPFVSRAQEGYMHEHPEILGKAGLAEWDAATKGKHLPEHAMHKKTKKHGFKRTTIEHHDDGSHTIRHEHESDSSKDKTHAVADLDAVHDKLEENVGEPNPGELEAEGQPQPEPQADSPLPPGMAQGVA